MTGTFFALGMKDVISGNVNRGILRGQWTTFEAAQILPLNSENSGMSVGTGGELVIWMIRTECRKSNRYRKGCLGSMFINFYSILDISETGSEYQDYDYTNMYTDEFIGQSKDSGV